MSLADEQQALDQVAAPRESDAARKVSVPSVIAAAHRARRGSMTYAA